MQREHERGEPCARHGKPSQNQPDQPRGARVQNDVHQVVAERVIAPEPVEDPERRVSDRVVLLCGADLEPDAPQAVQRSQIRSRDVRVVVPEQSAVPRWRVGDERRDEEHREGEPHRAVAPSACAAPGTTRRIRRARQRASTPGLSARGFRLARAHVARATTMAVRPSRRRSSVRCWRRESGVGRGDRTRVRRW